MQENSKKQQSKSFNNCRERFRILNEKILKLKPYFCQVRAAKDKNPSINRTGVTKKFTGQVGRREICLTPPGGNSR